MNKKQGGDQMTQFSLEKILKSQQTIKQAKVIQEVVTAEVSKLSHFVINKKQVDQMGQNIQE